MWIWTSFLLYSIRQNPSTKPRIADITSLTSHLPVFKLCFSFPCPNYRGATMPTQHLTECSKLFLLLMHQTLQLQIHDIPITHNKITTAHSTLKDFFNININRKILNIFKEINQTRHCHTNSLLLGGMCNSLRILEIILRTQRAQSMGQVAVYGVTTVGSCAVSSKVTASCNAHFHRARKHRKVFAFS